MLPQDNSGNRDDRKDVRRLPSIRDLFGINASDELGTLITSSDPSDRRSFSLAELHRSLPRPLRHHPRDLSAEFSTPPESPLTASEFTSGQSDWRASSRFSSVQDTGEGPSPISADFPWGSGQSPSWSHRTLPPLQPPNQSSSITGEPRPLPPLSSTFPLLHLEGSGRGRSVSDTPGVVPRDSPFFLPGGLTGSSSSQYRPASHSRRHTALEIGSVDRQMSDPPPPLLPFPPPLRPSRYRNEPHLYLRDQSQLFHSSHNPSNELQDSPLPNRPYHQTQITALSSEPDYHYTSSSLHHISPSPFVPQPTGPSEASPGFGHLQPSGLPSFSPSIPLSTDLPLSSTSSASPNDTPMQSASEETAEDQAKPAATAKYECSYCSKRFNRPSSLKIHVNTHTGAKPFQCPFPECGRRFSVMSNMRRHARVHSQNPRGSGDASPLGSNANATPSEHRQSVHFPQSCDNSSAGGPTQSELTSEDRPIPSPTFSSTSTSSYSRSTSSIPSPRLPPPSRVTPTVLQIHRHHRHHSSSEGREYRSTGASSAVRHSPGVRRTRSHQSSFLGVAPSMMCINAPRHPLAFVPTPALVSGSTRCQSPSESSESSGEDETRGRSNTRITASDISESGDNSTKG